MLWRGARKGGEFFVVKLLLNSKRDEAAGLIDVTPSPAVYS
jgi:hypothetical protein